MLLDKNFPSQPLAEALADSPFSKQAVTTFLTCFTHCQGYLDKTVFNRLRRHIEKKRGGHFNFRRRLDKAEAGRYIAWAELSLRNDLPDGWEPVYFLHPHTGVPVSTAPDSHSRPRLSQQQKQMLQQHHRYRVLLNQGRIIGPAPTLNGMERTPLLKIFGSPTSLDQLNRNYRLLRQKHHPDSSPYGAEEAKWRFDWLYKAYKGLCDNWSRFDPTNPDIPKERVQKQLQKQLTKPDGWWYWVG